MQHAIGYVGWKVVDGTYNAYRNYCAYNKPNDLWESIVEKGYATKGISSINEGDSVYHLNKMGFTLLEEMLKIKIEER